MSKPRIALARFYDRFEFWLIFSAGVFGGTGLGLGIDGSHFGLIPIVPALAVCFVGYHGSCASYDLSHGEASA